MIQNALAANGQNRTRATKMLGISRRTLQNKIKEV
jgi:transcriptional regulator with PAS, ATPase and Fis domain